DSTDMPPRDRGRMAAPPGMDRNGDGMRRACHRDQLPDHGRLEHGVIGRGKYPPLVRPRAVHLLDPAQPMLRRPSHVGSGWRQEANVGGRGRGEGDQFRHMRPDHDEHMADAAGPEGREGTLNHGPAADGKRQLRSAHARAVARGGNDGERPRAGLRHNAPYPAFGGRPFGTIGIDRSRTPAAWKIAFPTAGAMHTIGVSPAPAESRSLRSRSTVSRTGASRNRGTRYADRAGFRIWPFSNSICSYRAAPRPMITAPSIWLVRWSGLRMAPHSNAVTARTTWTLSLSTATSAHVET